ncbi:hypothetical protein B0J13DRAFT_649912 [Dactylonectria estremocensis]|uniref:AMP-dependent synthetase/ligase domain-containing protein n=1 Tax=Dactylonectria estremocensis TaxID=1079267 RepID=A0A9P9JAX8_9HYPO|nr:hypothetical protein B0J13DRAFT_649912 [Dactylonectria estremocensis]
MTRIGDALNTMLDIGVLCARKLAETHGEKLHDLHMKLWDLFAAAAASYPKHDALVSLWQSQDQASSLTQESAHGSEEPPLRWSYAQLKDKAERLAESLKRLGCRPGMRLSAVLWNSAEYGLFFWAAARLQMVFVPIDAAVPNEARAMALLVQSHVVVTQDAEDAAALDLAQTDLEAPCLRVQCSGQEVEGWVRLCDVSTEAEMSLNTVDGMTMTPLPENTDDTAGDEDKTALIIFTSGTTGQPKGCPHTNRNLASESCDFDPEVDPSFFLRWLVHTPVSHIFAVSNVVRAWRFGGTVVFPSPSFNVDATLRALVQEQCSVMSATPTLAKALMAHPSFPSPDELDLRLVTLAGTSICLEDIDLCRNGLGAEMAIQVYGLSEGAPLITFARTDPDLVDGYHPGVGKLLPGAAARICRPGSREILHCGDTGELHVGGTSIITRYYNMDEDESMYEDEAGPWLATGDQAKIDEHGVVYILGRYKDLIIRGGENIYPFQIESNLEQIPGVQAQVVGVLDELAGQVPVAIVILPDGVAKSQLIEKSRRIDPRHAVGAVYTLEELGLETFPVTSLGKVKKEVLRQKLAKLREAVQPREPQTAPIEEQLKLQPAQKYIEKLLEIWETLSGTRPAVTDSIMLLADSITLLRYCDSVLRVCGQRLYMHDFNLNDTVEKQAKLLLSRELQNASLATTHGQPASSFGNGSVAPVQQRQSSLAVTATDPPFSVEEKDIWESAQQTIERTGLADAAVEDILPIRYSLRRTAIGMRPQSYHNRMVFQVRDVPYEKIRQGVERALSSRPMLRTILFEASHKELFHAVLSPSTGLFDKLIQQVDIDTEIEAVQRSRDDSVEGHSSPFMFQSNLVKIGAGDKYYLIFTFNHSVIDALSLTQWHYELDRWIQDSTLEVPALTPYRLFSDLFSQYENSEPAQKSVRFHVKRLRGISRLGRALWPQQKAPGMMTCNDEGSLYVKERRQIRDTVWEGEWEMRAAEFQYPRSSRVICLPGLIGLRENHAIQPSLFARSAIVLFNVLQTGSSHAIFSSWESGRSWPFIPSWMDMLLPPPMSIDGPTVQWLLNMSEVVRGETVAKFLQRMVYEQEQMKQHEHVPWNLVVQGLRDEGDMAETASFRQSFVWDVSLAMDMTPGNRTDFKTLEPVSRYDWPDCGLFWNAFMIDSVNLYFIASWDTAQMNDREVDRCCDGLSDVMRKLADEGNWEKKVGDVFTV